MSLDRGQQADQNEPDGTIESNVLHTSVTQENPDRV